jgi:hypothetical protein
VESKAILFHSNEEKKCEEFVSEKIHLISSENKRDDIWLGVGMYFWDNEGNAKWWNEKQSKRNLHKKYKIIRVNADTSNLLDLTDYDVYKKMEEIWKNLCKKINADSEKPLGYKLDTLFHSFPRFKEKYMAIKVFGKYNRTPVDGLFPFDCKSMKAEPTMAVKCIYNVKNYDCILKSEIIEEV